MVSALPFPFPFESRIRAFCVLVNDVLSISALTCRLSSLFTLPYYRRNPDPRMWEFRSMSKRCLRLRRSKRKGGVGGEAMMLGQPLPLLETLRILVHDRKRIACLFLIIFVFYVPSWKFFLYLRFRWQRKPQDGDLCAHVHGYVIS